MALSDWLGASGPLVTAYRHAPSLAYAQLALVLLVAGLALRGRRLVLPAVAGLAALTFVWWLLALDQPYGLFVSDAITRWSADVAVAGATGGATEGFLSGSTSGAGTWGRLAAAGVPANVLLWLPSLIPLLGLLGIGLGLRLRAPVRSRRLAAVLWIAFSTSQLDALRGLGLVSGGWPRPGACLIVMVTASVLLGFRLARRPVLCAFVTAGGAVWAGIHAAIPATVPSVGVIGVCLALGLEQLPWLALAGLASSRHPRPPTDPLSIALGGGAAALVCALLGRDPWGASVLCRLGLVLASADEAAAWLRLLDRRLRRRTRWLASPLGSPGLALALLALLPGSFLVRWKPQETDALARLSLQREAWSPNRARALAWLRANTPAGAVVLAGAAAAPRVAIVAGRRVLRAPGLAAPVDEDRRLRLERRILAGASPAGLVSRYGLAYVFSAPGAGWDTERPEAARLDALPNLIPRYRDESGFAVYEIVAQGGSSPVGPVYDRHGGS